jgi:DNA-binding transcriptional LysR family regulator
MSREKHLAGLPDLIKRIQARSPNLRIRIEVQSPAELELSIDSGEFDIGYMETGFLRRDLDTLPLFDMYSSVYCAKDHPLALVPDEVIDDNLLSRYKSVVFDVNAELTNPLRRDDSEVTCSSESSLFFIMSGVFIGYLSDALAEPWRDAGSLRRIAPQRYTRNIPGGLVFRKSSLSNPIIMQAIELARESQPRVYSTLEERGATLLS